MLVEEIKKLLPTTEIYALDRNVNYILVYDLNQVAASQVRGMLRYLSDSGLSIAVLAGEGDPDKLLSLYAIKEQEVTQ